jgi:DNA-binding transcriptional MerR regulator
MSTTVELDTSVKFKAKQCEVVHVRIGELARRTGVSERSLRYYEQQGLLTAGRTEGGHRSYDESAVDRVCRIQVLLAAGLSSATIAGLLPCMRDSDGGPSAIATPRLVAALRSERERIEHEIADLTRSRSVLDEVIEAAAGAGSAATAAPRRLPRRPRRPRGRADGS